MSFNHGRQIFLESISFTQASGLLNVRISVITAVGGLTRKSGDGGRWLGLCGWILAQFREPRRVLPSSVPISTKADP